LPNRRSPRSARLLVLALGVPLLAAASCGAPVEFGLPTLAGVMPVEVALGAGVDPADVRVALDGNDVTASFTAGGAGLVGALPVPAPGSHRLAVTRPIALSFGSFTEVAFFEAPTAAPEVLAVEPTGTLPRGAWLRFRLAAPAAPSDLVGFGFAIECDGEPVARSAHVLDDGSLVLNPSPALPAGAACRAAWRAQGGAVAEASFAVAPDAGFTSATVLYERASPLSIAPFPDDYWLEDDPTQPSGHRVELPDPQFPESTQRTAFNALAGLVRQADGWSRQTPIVVALSDPLEPTLVPEDPTASVDPLAPIALVDVDPASPDYGQRIPYRLLARTDPRPASVGGGVDHNAIVFPTIDLREHGRYALVVRRGAFAAGEPGRSFGPSPLFTEVLAGPSAGESPEATRARAAVGDALAALASLPGVPIPPEDVALALSISIRTHPSVNDLVAVKEQALAATPPELVLPDLASDPCPRPPSSMEIDPFCVRLIAKRGVEVHGRVRLPRYRTAAGAFDRDPVTGAPRVTGTDEVPLVLTLPLAALDGPVLPVMYQHGNPGHPDELLGGNSEQIDDAGFALMGVRDSLNREICRELEFLTNDELCIQSQVLVIFGGLLVNQRLADFWLQTAADQIYFLRAIQGMASLDLLHEDAGGNPALGPDGQPEIDPSTILYKGISEGANNAQRFLPFAPEILAAEATVGGARLGETLIHQSADEILSQITTFLSQLKPTELWVGLSLFQAAFDPQDGHTYLRHLYQEPLLPFAGSSDVTPPSTIWTEGVGDTLVPNNASRAMARELGIPHVRPVEVAVPGLEQVDAPLAGNIAPGITAGYFQFRPSDTPDCRDRVPPQLEGHYCAQSSAEAKRQRLHFLLTALDGDAEIVDPF
jgi:hypothetical protein